MIITRNFTGALFVQRRTLFYTNTGLLLTITSNKSEQWQQYCSLTIVLASVFEAAAGLSLSLACTWKLVVLFTRTLDVVLW